MWPASGPKPAKANARLKEGEEKVTIPRNEAYRGFNSWNQRSYEKEWVDMR